MTKIITTVLSVPLISSLVALERPGPDTRPPTVSCCFPKEVWCHKMAVRWSLSALSLSGGKLAFRVQPEIQKFFHK